MDLLKSLQVVETRRSVSQGPHTEVMHMSEDLPIVAERDLLAWLQKLINVFWLAVIARDSELISKSYSLALNERRELVHFI